jgi:hypothetical protein
VNWIHLAQDWKTVTLVNTVMNLQIPLKKVGDMARLTMHDLCHGISKGKF